MSDEAVFSADGVNLEFTLYDDRVEALARKRRQVIPLSDIAEVLASRRPKKLVIVTTEGKHYEYLLGHDVEAARASVTAQIARFRAANIAHG